MSIDYLDKSAEDAAEMLRKQQLYVAYAIENGDAAWVDKVGEVTIRIRLKKKKDEPKDNQ